MSEMKKVHDPTDYIWDGFVDNGVVEIECDCGTNLPGNRKGNQKWKGYN